MADDATDVQESNEISLDDFMADEQESPKVVPSTTEETKPAAEPEAPKEETKADDTAVEPDKAEAKEPETEKPAEPEVETDTAQPQTKADERKTQLSTEIRDLVAQRNALKTEVEKANAEVYQPATEQELVDEGLSATDAKVEALRQQIEVRDYNERVAEAQLTLNSEANRVLTDFAWTNSDSPEYNEELSSEAAQLLQANLILDPNTNQVIGTNMSPYQIYKTLNKATGISQAQGQLKGQQAAEQMLANADTASAASPPKQKVDPLVELWKSDD